MQFLKSCYLFFVSIITFLWDSCVIITERKTTHSNGICIIRVDSIGDFILWLDAANEFRNLYPNTKITLIANQKWSDLARLLPYWDEVIPVNRRKLTRNLVYRSKVLRQTRSLGFETAIQPVYSREYLRGDSLIRATGALHKIGSTGDLSNVTFWQKRISDKWYSHLIPATERSLMELQRNAEFMAGLGFQNFSARIPELPKLIDLPARLNIDRLYFVIAPGASRSGKLWPIQRFSAVLQRVVDLTGFLPVVCGDQEERTLCDKLIQLSNIQSINLAGLTTLPELVETIRHAKILISNDSSFIHIAAAVGTPSVCILGGGHYGRFMPYKVDEGDHIAPVSVYKHMNCFNCNWKCNQPHDKRKAKPCISSITLEQVMEAIEQIVAKLDLIQAH